jgi:hypothetical protein
MKIGIHQPNFIPWLGIFNRIYLVDKFIFFDHVQAPTGKSWLFRNRILMGKEPKWLSMPVKKSGRLGQLVKDVEINYETWNEKKYLRTLEANYKKTPFFEPIIAEIKEVHAQKHQHLADLNIALICRMAKLLGLQRNFIRSSSLLDENPSLLKLSGNELVLRICKACEAEKYFSGTGGCSNFIEPLLFENSGIEFWFQDFELQKYTQAEDCDFVSHLSIIDPLFNIGPEKTYELIAQNRLIRGIDKTET